MKRIAIIGGGASGLAAAIAAAERCRRSGAPDAQVSVYEMDERTGRRILATGNGRCNFSHVPLEPELYHNSAFVSRVIEGFPPERVLAWFDDLGLCWKREADGRLLPRTGKASTVLDVLRARAQALGVQEVCGCAVREVLPPAAPEGVLTLRMADGRFFRANAVIVATGGQDALGFLPAAVERAPFTGVLGALKTDTACTSPLDNIRVQARVTLTRDAGASGGHALAQEDGEVLFRTYGVSGICVFNLSRFAQPGDVLHINLWPECHRAELAAVLASRSDALLAVNENACVSDLFCGMLLPRVAEVVGNVAGVAQDLPLAAAGWEQIGALAAALQDIPLRVRGIADKSPCQAHRGGVAVAAVDEHLQATACPGLYVCGEALDVDGPCGGYNLHWAWTSGLVAGAAAAERAAACGCARPETADA